MLTTNMTRQMNTMTTTHLFWMFTLVADSTFASSLNHFLKLIKWIRVRLEMTQHVFSCRSFLIFAFLLQIQLKGSGQMNRCSLGKIKAKICCCWKGLWTADIHFDFIWIVGFLKVFILKWFKWAVNLNPLNKDQRKLLFLRRGTLICCSTSARSCFWSGLLICWSVSRIMEELLPQFFL